MRQVVLCAQYLILRRRLSELSSLVEEATRGVSGLQNRMEQATERDLRAATSTVRHTRNTSEVNLHNVFTQEHTLLYTHLMDVIDTYIYM